MDLKPDYAEVESNLAAMLQAQGRLDEAMDHYRHALQVNPSLIALHCNMLACLQNVPGQTLADLAAAHAEWNAPCRAAAIHLAASCQCSRPGAAATDRVCFQRPGAAPGGLFQRAIVRESRLAAVRDHLLLNAAGQGRFDGPDRSGRDAMARRWRAVRRAIGRTDPRRRRRYSFRPGRSQRSTADCWCLHENRPPIQITWIGYVGTTGLAAMNYLLADRLQVVAGSERHFREKVLCLPDDYVCYDPPSYAPAVGPLPALEKGHATFGCFNRLAKISPQAVVLWSRILHRVPDARLTLKFWGLQGPATREHYTELFAAGIDARRLDLLGGGPHPEMLAQYNQVDIALDTFPYSGGLITCEALWMGVPVVTCPGETFASRHAMAHLTTVGLRETVARDWDDYVDIAAALAADWSRLSALARAWPASRGITLVRRPQICRPFPGPDARRVARLVSSDSIRGVMKGWHAWLDGSPRPFRACHPEL